MLMTIPLFLMEQKIPWLLLFIYLSVLAVRQALHTINYKKKGMTPYGSDNMRVKRKFILRQTS